ncbi:MAG: M24 family metallopeptidase [Thermomicrobiales bacterium]
MPRARSVVPWDWEARQRYMAPHFPLAEYDTRLARTRAAMESAGLTHLIVYGNSADPGHTRWLSGFISTRGDTFVVLAPDAEPMLATNGILHDEPMHAEIYTSIFKDTRAHVGRDTSLIEDVADFVRTTGGAAPKRIGIAGYSVIPYRIVTALSRLLDGAEFENVDANLLGLRRIKSPREIATMRRAAEISGAGIAATAAACVPGVTEQAALGIGHGTLFAAGAEGLAFNTAVSAGPMHAGVKHVTPTWRAMQEGDLVFIDMGAKLDGYYADVSRCVAVGEPTKEGRQLLAAGEILYKELMAIGKPGQPIAAWQDEGIRIGHQLGYEDAHMEYGFGHGLGCLLFERPNLRRHETTDVLEPGMIFAFEPMFVVEGLGTAVVEETVLVTEKGVEPLSGLWTQRYSR